MWTHPPETAEDDTSFRTTRNPGRLLRHFVTTSAALLTIAYGSALILSRTAGFRRLLSDRLGEQLGGEVTIAATALTADVSLRLENVRFGDAIREKTPAIHVGRARLSPAWPWHPGRLRALEGADVVIRFVQKDDGRWMPERLSPLAAGIEQWIGLGVPAWRAVAAESAHPTLRHDGPVEPALAPPMRIALRNATLSWFGADGTCRARIEGLTLEAAPVALPMRPLQYVRLSAHRLSSGRGDEFSDVRAEFLADGGRCVLLDFGAGTPLP